MLFDNPEALRAGCSYLYERGCWVTRKPTEEEQRELDKSTFTPEEYLRRQLDRAERGWIGALRDVFDSQRGRKEVALDDAWQRFWQTFRDCTGGYEHRERAVLRARDEWVRLGGKPEDFRTP